MSLNSDFAESFKRNFYFKREAPVFSEADFKTIKDYFFNFTSKVPENIRSLNFANHPAYIPAVSDWVGRDEILEIVRPILGNDLVFWSIGVSYKPAFSEFEVGWHIDSHCWMRDQVIFPPDALVLFLSLTEMTEENGALSLIPGLNTPKFYNHEARDKEKFFFEYEIAVEELAGQKPVLLEMKENQICGFASHVPHRSGPNRSSKPRLGITLRYIQSSVHITGTPLDGRNSYLVSGVNLSGYNHASLQQQPAIGGLSYQPR